MGVTRRWKRAGHQASKARRVGVGWRAFGKMAPMVPAGIPTSVSSPSPFLYYSYSLPSPAEIVLFFFENLSLELVSKRGEREGRREE